MELYKFKNFSQFSNIEHFVTTRKGGYSVFPYANNNMSLESSDNQTVNNRLKLSEKIKLPLENFVYQYQTHTKNIELVTACHKGRGITDIRHAIQENDAMITSEPEICIVVMAADCVPVFLFDSKKNIIAAIHAGWKGTVQKIVYETVTTMIKEYNSNPADIIAGIGPSIGSCCYEIGNEVVSIISENFTNYKELLIYKSEQQKFHFDLWLSNKLQLIDAGVKSENIEIANICTKCNNNSFYSARCGDKGRFSAGIYLKK